MAYKLNTKHGHNMYDMSSMLQKAIRRSDFNLAGYAAYELAGNFQNYLWKRLLCISAEDCYGIMTREILALKIADDLVNGNKKGYERSVLYIAKAVTLLCMARKNRDGCYFACNFMLPERCLEEDEIEHVDITKCNLGIEGIPDWVYDCHTLKGKLNGKTEVEMIRDEQKALKPHQPSLFDDYDWEPHIKDRMAKGQVNEKERLQFEEFKKDKKSYEQENV